MNIIIIISIIIVVMFITWCCRPPASGRWPRPRRTARRRTCIKQIQTLIKLTILVTINIQLYAHTHTHCINDRCSFEQFIHLLNILTTIM